MNSQTRYVLHRVFAVAARLTALIISCFGILLTQTSFAASSNEKVVIQGRIVDPSGVAVADNNVNFDISIYTPTTGVAGSHCLLYRETQNGIDMSTSAGTFVLQIGDGTRVGTGPTLRETFTNASVASFSSLTCGVGSAYTPGAIDDRSIEITVSFSSQVLTLAAIPVKAVPYAFQANQIGGYGINNLVRLNGAGSTTNLNVDQFNYITGFYHDNSTSGVYTDDYLDAQNLQIKNLAAPTANNDAATKTYVDTAISGVTATLPTIGNAQIWVGNSSGVAVAVTMSGDGSIDNTGKLTVTGINGKAITGAPTSGQILQYNGTAWVPTTSTSLSSTLTSAHIFVGNGSNIATDVAMSGDATISNTGALTLNTVPVTKGGTGVITYNLGEVPVYDGTKLTGMGCSVIGQVLQWQSGTGFVCATLSGISPVGSTLNDGQIWVGNSSNVAAAVSTSGDVTLSNAGAFKVTQIQGTAVDATTPTSNQVLAYNGSKWIATTPSASGTTITGGTTKVLSMFNATGDNVINSSVTDNGTSGVDFANSKIEFGGSLFMHSTGNNNVFLGDFSGNTSLTATWSTAVGFASLYALTSGSHNTAVGASSLSANTTGSDNTAVGEYAIYQNITGTENTAVGALALGQNTGSQNTGLGKLAGSTNTSGALNTFVGYQSGRNILGSNNTVIGANAGINNGTGSSNVYLGAAAGPSSSVSESNKLYINNAAGTPLIGGNFSTGVAQINSKLELPLSSTTPTPSTGYGSVYAKADGQLYYKNTSTEYQLSGVSAGGVTSLAATAPLAVDASTGAITASMNLASAHVYVGNGSGKAADVAMSGDASIDNTGKVTVTGINGKAVTGTPTSNQILQYNGTAWVPTTSTSLSSTLASTHIFVGNGSAVATDVAMSGDATISNAGALKVIALQNVAVDATAPTSNQVLAYNGSKWIATTPSASGTTITGGTTKVLSMFNATGDNVINSSVTDNGANGVNFTNRRITFGAGSLILHTTGSWNTFLGYASGNTSMTGVDNTAVGYSSLAANTTGNWGTAIGTSSLAASTTGWANTAVGYESLESNTTGGYNAALGHAALSSSVSGSSNTAVGDSSLAGNTTGTGNVGLGSNAGDTLTAGDKNLFLGYYAGPTVAGTYNNKLYIHNARSDTPLIGGDFSAGYVQINKQVELPLTSTTPTPTAGYGRVYAKADGQLYYKNASTEYQLSGVSAGGVTSLAATAPLAVDTSTGAITASMNLASTHVYVGNGSGKAADVAMSGDAGIDNTGKVTVTALQGKAVSATAPTANQILQFNGTAWVPTTSTSLSSTLASTHIFVGNGSAVATDVAMSGDATISNTGALKVTALQNVAVDSTAPTSNQVLAYNGSKWIATTPTSGGTTITGGTTKVLSMFNTTGDNVINSSITDNGASGVNFANSKITFGGSLFAFNRGTENTFLGVSAGNISFTTASAVENTGIGTGALGLLTTGANNAAVGAGAGSDLSSGSSNSFLGYFAGASVTTNSGNVAIGSVAMQQGNPYNSVAVGEEALRAADASNDNVGVGFAALNSIITGSYNVAVGTQAGGGYAGGSAQNNTTAMGYYALYKNKGDNNTGIGYGALSTITTGTNNTALGYNAGGSSHVSATSANNVFIGANSGPATTAVYSNKLYIHNASTDTPLIGGDFSAGYVQINKQLEIPLSSTTPTANTGYGRVYAKADGQLYYKNASTEYQLSGVSAGGVTSLAATAPLAVDASTGAITASMNLASAHVYVGNGSGKATDVAMSGDATISNTGALTLATVPVTKGGTGETTWSLGQIPYYNGTKLTGLSCTTGQSIIWDVSNGFVCGTPSATGSSLATGNIWVGNSSGVATPVTTSGDVSLSTGGAFKVTAIQNVAVSATAPSSGQVLTYNGTAWTPTSSASPTGSGTINYASKWTAAGALGDSQVFDDGTNVGVGTATPQAKLDVNGALRIANDTTACSSTNEGAIRFNSTTKLFEKCDGSSWSASQLGAAVPASTVILMSSCPTGWTDNGTTGGGPGTASCNGVSCHMCQSPATDSLIPANSVALLETCPSGWTSLGSAGGPGSAGVNVNYLSCESPAVDSALPLSARVMSGASCPSQWSDLGAASVGSTTATCGGSSCHACQVPGQVVSQRLLYGGDGGSTVGNGGAIAIKGGMAVATGLSGGSVSIQGGTGEMTTGSGGDITLSGGDGGSTSGSGGSINLSGGYGATKYGNVILNSSGDGNVGIGTVSPGATLDVVGTIRISNSSAGHVDLKIPTGTASTASYTLPIADGTSGQVLSTDGSGNLTWTANGGSGTLVGDVTGASGANTVAAIQGTAVSATTPTSGQILQFNGTSWVPTTSTSLSSTLTSTHIFVGNSSGKATDVAMSGDATISNTGALTLATVPVTKGGTGETTFSLGQIPYYNGTKLTGLSCTTGQSIIWDVANGFVCGTPSATGSSLATGNIWVGNSSGVAAAVAPIGDVAMTNAGSFTVTGIQGLAVAATAPTSGQVLTYNGTNWTPSTSAGTTGSGTTNYVSKWTSASDLGNSLIYDNGTKIGIGTTSPSSIIHIATNSASTQRVYIQNAATAGAAEFYAYSGSAADVRGGASGTGGMFGYGSTTGYMGTFSNSPFILGTNAVSRVLIDGSGNVGIGTTNPSAKLTVAGGDAKINGITVGLGGGSVSGNTAVGASALIANTTGNNNIALGSNALSSGTTVYGNVAIGTDTLKNVGSTNYNVAVGYLALTANTTGQPNTAVGSWALSGNTTGSSNVAIGYQAGSAWGPSSANTTGTGNTFIGAGAGPGTTTQLSNATAIGNNAVVTASNSIVLGSLGTSVGIGITNPSTMLQVGGEISPAADNAYSLGDASLRFTAVYAVNGTIQTSDARQKTNIQESDLGLNFINKLRPVSYNWKSGPDSVLHYGLIAQETEIAVNDSHAKNDGQKTPIVDHDEKTDRYGLRYTEFISPIIKAIQELYHRIVDVEVRQTSQEREIASVKANSASQTEVDALKAENAQLKARADKAEQENAAMKARLDRIEESLNSK